MPDIRVQDEQGNIHVFPDGSTPEMIAKAMNVKPPAPAFQVPDATAQARQTIANIIPNEEAYRQDPRLRSVSLPQAISPAQVAARENEYNRQSGQLIGQTAAGMATGGLLPFIKGAGFAPNIVRLLGRAGASGAGMSAGTLAGGGTPEEAKRAGRIGLISQPLAEGMSALTSKVAPSLAESALKITERMRGRGRTIGQAVLENTRGVRPATLAKQSASQIGQLTNRMEDAVHQATLSGKVGSTQPAHDVLDEALANLPRNARSIQEKMSGLRDLLDLNPVPGGQAGRMIHTPEELLEIKRGIGKEISTWPPEWQKLSDVKQVQQRLYGAIDGELDRLVPGNAELNQKISSLIPAKQQAARLSDQATMLQRVAGRVAAHTGALAGSAAGGYLGYREGGPRGAAFGAALGLGIPEFLASPTTQMALARSGAAAGRTAVSPYLLPLSKSVIASQKPRKNKDDAEKQ